MCSIMEKWLMKLNKQMKQQKRKILLFMDNATSHPNMNLSNIKLVFFPSNTTSVLQPMDQGAIYTVKLNYRKRVLNRLVRLMDTVDNASDLVKAINVLDAIHWLADSVAEVSKKCVEGAFKTAEFIANEPQNEENDVEDETNLRQLIVLLRRIDSECSVSEFISMDSETYTENGSIDECVTEIDEESEDEEDELTNDNQPQEPMEVLSSNDMLVFTEKIKQSALAKGNTALFNKMSECLMLIENEISNKKPTQTKLDDYFTN